MTDLRIKKFVSVDSRSARVNGKIVLENEGLKDFGTFMKQIYHYRKVDYPKFFKMEPLAKLGLITSELLLPARGTDPVLPEDRAIVLANSASSLHTDERYNASVNDIPSPAVFVYTLPNVTAGEICIYHGIRGENAFFVQESFDALFLVSYVELLFSTTSTKKAVTGWVEMGLDGHYFSFLTEVVQASEGKHDSNFTAEIMNQICKPWKN